MTRKIQNFVACLIVISSLWPVEASSPVVLWTIKRIGEGNLESNLNEFSSQQFADLVAWKTEQGNIPIIAFGLESLSLEDLTPQSGIGANEPFRKLRKITDASAETLLFPAVQSAGESLSILQSKGYQVYQINAGDVLPKLETANSILIINDKTSVNMDDEILRVFSKYTLDFPNVVGMLWGKRSTWTEEPEDEVNEILSRKKRQAPSTTTATPVTPGDLFKYKEKGIFMVFKEAVLTVYHRADKNSAKFTNPTVTQTPNGTDILLKISFPASTAAVSTTQFDLMFQLESKMGYWSSKLATVTLKGRDTQTFTFENIQLTSEVDLTCPVQLSFHCSRFGSLRPVDKMEDLKQNHTFTIELNKFQMQAYQPEDSKEVFLDDYECVGFFTPGIWMGILVTIVLLSILTWGMMMIMDVKTMDRFDDPKGKPISFAGND